MRHSKAETQISSRLTNHGWQLMLIPSFLKTVPIGNEAVTVIQVYLMLEQRRQREKWGTRGPIGDPAKGLCHCWALVRRIPWTYAFWSKTGNALLGHRQNVMRPPSPLLSQLSKPHPLALTSQLLEVLLDFLAFPTWPDVRLKGRSQRCQDAKYRSEMSQCVKGAGGRYLNQGLHSRRLEPASPWPVPGSQSAVLPLFFWAQEAVLF